MSALTTSIEKLPLLVVGIDPDPTRGSEAGKAYHWGRALSEFFQIHYICLRRYAEVCQQSGLCRDWIIHPVDSKLQGGLGLGFYRFYHEWCRRALEKCFEVIPRVNPVGIHHPSLGSFRMFPRYDHLPLPYTLGPLGGGETTPLKLLRGARLPLKQLSKELLRPALNYACLANPQVRRVLQKARMVLATTPETEHILQWAGAKNTATTFPDAIDFSEAPRDPLEGRRQQLPELSQEFRCIWSGRALWWKCPQIALQFIRRLKDNGVQASLAVYTAGPALNGLKNLAEQLGIKEAVQFNGFVRRDQLLAAHQRSHLFVFPSLHESGSSAIPEAYSTGLPSMTLALGGTWFPTDRHAGLNETPDDIESWLAKGVEMVRRWIHDPQLWLQACQVAVQTLPKFTPVALTENARTHLVPCFNRTKAA